MGSGIAQIAAAAGYKTIVREVNDGALQAGLGRELHHACGDRGKRDQRNAEVRIRLAQECDAVADPHGRDGASDGTSRSRLSKCHEVPAFWLPTFVARFSRSQAAVLRRNRAAPRAIRCIGRVARA